MTPLGKETFDIVQDHDEDDDEWDDANNDDDEDDDDMNETDSLPGLLSQLAGDGRCLRMSFISWIKFTVISVWFLTSVVHI